MTDRDRQEVRGHNVYCRLQKQRPSYLWQLYGLNGYVVSEQRLGGTGSILE
jgi:hypothetical protein